MNGQGYALAGGTLAQGLGSYPTTATAMTSTRDTVSAALDEQEKALNALFGVVDRLRERLYSVLETEGPSAPQALATYSAVDQGSVLQRVRTASKGISMIEAQLGVMLGRIQL